MIWLGTGKWRLMKEKSRCRAIWGIVRKVVPGRFSAIYKLLCFKAQLSFLSVFLTSLISLKYYYSITYNILDNMLNEITKFYSVNHIISRSKWWFHIYMRFITQYISDNSIWSVFPILISSLFIHLEVTMT